MLRKLEVCDNPSTFFLCCDIETFASPHPREGELLAIDTCWRDERGSIQHVSHTRWEEWWDWLVCVAREDTRFRCVYAHNGGGFDWLSLTERLLRWLPSERVSISAACAGSKMITMNVCVEKRFNIHLCDSLRLLMSGLDVLGKKFVGRGKVDLGGKMPHELYVEDRKLFVKYHQSDTELLLEVLENAFHLLHTRIAKISTLGFTIGGLALKVFRASFMEREISIPRDSYLKSFLRKGYTGGRVETFRRSYFESVRVYDINSLYPSVMREIPVPFSERGYWTTRWESEKVGVWEIKFVQLDTAKPPVLMVGGEGVYRGEGVYFSPEIELFLKMGGEIELIKGYVFIDTEIVFKEFVDTLYSLRMEDSNGPLGTLCKFLLNSLYGKFGQHAERETIILDTSEEFSELVAILGDPERCQENEYKNIQLRSINTRLGVFGLTKKSQCEFEHVAIAGMITSAARVKLYEGMEYVCSRMGIGHLAYVDTDSLHVVVKNFEKDCLSADTVGSSIGKFKLEFEGSGVYAGKKLYALKSVDGKEKIRAKGVSVGGNFGAKLSFSDIIDIVNGQEKKCEFSQFSTPRQVFAEGKPCRLRKRTRTLKMYFKKKTKKTSLLKNLPKHLPARSIKGRGR